jgi:hypothetical protein
MESLWVGRHTPDYVRDSRECRVESRGAGWVTYVTDQVAHWARLPHAGLTVWGLPRAGYCVQLEFLQAGNVYVCTETNSGTTCCLSLCTSQAISRARPSYSGVTTWAAADLAPLSAEADCLEGGGGCELDREGRWVVGGAHPGRETSGYDIRNGEELCGKTET